MFAQSLPDARKWELLKIVRLLQVFDAPLLWEGKTEEELTGTTDLSDIEFATSAALQQVWGNAARIYGDEDDLDNDKDTTGIIKNVLDEIRKLRITRQSDQQERLKIATAVLREEILGQAAPVSDTPKESTQQVTLDPQAAWKFPEPGGSAWPFATSSVSAKSRSKPEKATTFLPKHSRIVLFEAMRFSFDNGGLSDAKRNLLQVASVVYDIDGESFNELLSQAIALHKEMKRSVNLVLE